MRMHPFNKRRINLNNNTYNSSNITVRVPLGQTHRMAKYFRAKWRPLFIYPSQASHSCKKSFAWKHEYKAKAVESIVIQI